VNNQASNYWTGREIDNKAKRRVERGDTIAFIGRAWAITAAGNTGVTVGINARVLLKFN